MTTAAHRRALHPSFHLTLKGDLYQNQNKVEESVMMIVTIRCGCRHHLSHLKDQDWVWTGIVPGAEIMSGSGRGKNETIAIDEWMKRPPIRGVSTAKLKKG